MRHLVPVLLVLLLAGPASAEVLSSAPGGFAVRAEHTVAGDPAGAWPAVLDIGSWWHHSFSGDTGNFTLTAEPGGAWIEHLPEGGFVEHMRVVVADPGERLVLRGALGPLLEEAATGTLLIALAATDEGATVTLTYRVAGYRDGGFEAWALGVDRVIGEAAARLARRIETGSAE